MSEKITASEALAEMLADGMLADQMGSSFTCAEIDKLVAFLHAWGEPAHATLWLNAHARNDDEGDSHYDPRLALERTETKEA